MTFMHGDAARGFPVLYMSDVSRLHGRRPDEWMRVFSRPSWWVFVLDLGDISTLEGNHPDRYWGEDMKG